MQYDAAFEYVRLVGTDIGENGGPSSFGAIPRGVLDRAAFQEEGCAKQAAGGFHALAAAAVKTYAIHTLSSSFCSDSIVTMQSLVYVNCPTDQDDHRRP